MRLKLLIDMPIDKRKYMAMCDCIMKSIADRRTRAIPESYRNYPKIIYQDAVDRYSKEGPKNLTLTKEQKKFFYRLIKHGMGYFSAAASKYSKTKLDEDSMYRDMFREALISLSIESKSLISYNIILLGDYLII